jgi:hypothetical protein
MAVVATQNLVIYQGADFQRALEFKDESEVLMNLTGYTVRGQAKVSYSDSSAAFAFTFTLRNQTTDTGMVDMSLPAATSAAITITKITEYIYDLELVDGSGIVRRFLEGKIKLHPEVTK